MSASNSINQIQLAELAVWEGAEGEFVKDMQVVLIIYSSPAQELLRSPAAGAEGHLPWPSLKPGQFLKDPLSKWRNSHKLVPCTLLTQIQYSAWGKNPLEVPT